MIVRFFKSSNTSVYILLPLIALSIWAFGFVFPSTLALNNNMPLYELISPSINKVHWISIVIAITIVIGEAFLLNYIVNENEILTKQSFLPALFYILFVSNNKDMLQLYPQLFANLFLLFAINKLLNSYRKDKAYSQVFDAGLLVAISTLFYFPYVFLIPVLGVALVVFRPFIWREWIISIIGVLVPYFFVAVFYFWNDALGALWYEKMQLYLLHAVPPIKFSQGFYFTMFIGWGIVLFSFSRLFGSVTSGSQKSKKGFVLLLWVFLLSIPAAIFTTQLSTRSFSVMAIPVAVFCSNYFLNIKKQWVDEILFTLLYFSIIINLIAQAF